MIGKATADKMTAKVIGKSLSVKNYFEHVVMQQKVRPQNFEHFFAFREVFCLILNETKIVIERPVLVKKVSFFQPPHKQDDLCAFK